MLNALLGASMTTGRWPEFGSEMGRFEQNGGDNWISGTEATLT
nr:hypothetical protein [Novosphingobium panipatense]